MGWDEIQIDKLIKTHRKNLEKEMSNGGTQFLLFKNPTEYNPVETSEFLSYLHPRFMDTVPCHSFHSINCMAFPSMERKHLSAFIKTIKSVSANGPGEIRTLDLPVISRALQPG